MEKILTVPDENYKMVRQVKTLLLLIAASAVLCSCRTAIPPVVEAPAAQPEEILEVEIDEQETVAEEFVVTDEVYLKTFDEIEEFIGNLNEIISNEDYETWLTYLSGVYIERTSDTEYLREQSEKPLLKQNNITLRSLQDYFIYVVVPSRTQVTVDEIEFIDENQVKAFAMIKNTRALLYLLVRVDGKWKIGLR